jgi:sec-independent protein translocase protein TatA
MRLGWLEILLFVAILLLLFGSKRIPELMRGLGRGAREFKEGLHGDEKDNKKNDNEP